MKTGFELLLYAYAMGVVVSVGWVVAARATGVDVDEVAVGAGPGARFTLRGTRVRIGPIPTGAFVRFFGAVETEPGWRAPGSVSALGPLTRAVVFLAGVVALALCAAALVGPAAAAAAFMRTPQTLAALFSAGGASVVDGFLARAPLTKAGVFFAKAAWLNLLPLPGSASFAAVLELLRGDRATPPLSLRVRGLLQLVLWPVWLILAGRLFFLFVLGDSR